MNKLDHPFVYAWCKKMGSYNYYIQAQLDLAKKEKAPANAIFRRDNGTWATTDGFTDYAINELNEYIAGTRGGIGK